MWSITISFFFHRHKWANEVSQSFAFTWSCTGPFCPIVPYAWSNNLSRQFRRLSWESIASHLTHYRPLSSKRTLVVSLSSQREPRREGESPRTVVCGSDIRRTRRERTRRGIVERPSHSCLFVPVTVSQHTAPTTNDCGVLSGFILYI